MQAQVCKDMQCKAVLLSLKELLAAPFQRVALSGVTCRSVQESTVTFCAISSLPRST